MTKRNQSRARANTPKIVINDDDRVNTDAEMNPDHVIFPQIENANQIVTLKHIIETHKIKCDPKLIRRVLRKYYAHKIDHKLRDAWTFNTSQIPTVVQLIDTHCRAGKSA